MSQNENAASQAPWAVIVVVLVAVAAIVVWQLMPKEQEVVVEPPVVIEPEIVPVEPEETPIEPEPVIEPVVPVEVPERVAVIEEVEKTPLPTLDESDHWIQQQLSNMTWRKELLKLVINEDMIRRFVVFTDNFARGQLAYEHSPFTTPSSAFSALTLKPEGNSEETLLWDDSSTRRFSLYVDLLRSMDSETLVSWYYEAKPLIAQAYAELGYSEDFNRVLQAAITRVLDMEIPKTPIELTRPSVMYQYKDKELEALPETDKLLLRLGRENLLVVKSVLLELNEKIARERN